MGCGYSSLDSKEMVSRCRARKRYMKQLVKGRHSFSAAHSMYLSSLRNTGSVLLQFATYEAAHQHLDHMDREEEVSEAANDHRVALGKDLLQIIKELDDCFLKAANAAGPLSAMLQVPICAPTYSDHGKSLSPPMFWPWGSNSARWNAFGKFCEDPMGNNVDLTDDGNAGHCSTIERLYSWEKKLYLEVKNAEQLKSEHEKKADILRKLELKTADYIKTENAKKEVQKLESQMMVALQAIETTSVEIIKLRESELYPQLLALVKGLTSMWRSMYEFHQVQTHISQQLKYLSFGPSNDPTSEILQQSTLQLELEAQKWHLSFCSLIKAQRDYVQSLTGWLRLSLFQVVNSPLKKMKQDSAIYSLCEEWQLSISNSPDKVASEGIKSFLATIHAIVVQQAEEQKQKRRSESATKELEKRNSELRSLESKYGPYSMSESIGETSRDLVRVKRAKVEVLRAKIEDEKAEYKKAISVTRSLTISNLQMSLPRLFQAMTGFANVCAQALESVHNQAETIDDLHNVKMLLPCKE